MRRKSDDPNIVGVDTQRRICLTREMLREMELAPRMNVVLTMDPQGLILIFRNDEDMRAYALADCHKIKSMTEKQAEYLYSYNRIRVSIDSRGRLILPENFLFTSGITVSARVVSSKTHLTVASPDRAADIHRQLVEKWQEHNEHVKPIEKGQPDWQVQSEKWANRLPFSGN